MNQPIEITNQNRIDLQNCQQLCFVLILFTTCCAVSHMPHHVGTNDKSWIAEHHHQRYPACKQGQEEYALEDLIATDLHLSRGAKITEKVVHPEELHDAMLFFLHYLGHSRSQSGLLREQHPSSLVPWHHTTLSYPYHCGGWQPQCHGYC